MVSLVLSPVILYKLWCQWCFPQCWHYCLKISSFLMANVKISPTVLNCIFNQASVFVNTKEMRYSGVCWTLWILEYSFLETSHFLIEFGRIMTSLSDFFLIMSCSFGTNYTTSFKEILKIIFIWKVLCYNKLRSKSST